MENNSENDSKVKSAGVSLPLSVGLYFCGSGERM